MDVPSILLIVGQALFMVLPLTGMYAMRAGNPASITWIKGINHTVATLGFIVLIAMFWTKKAFLGVQLCSVNLALRLIEWARIIHLHFQSSDSSTTLVSPKHLDKQQYCHGSISRLLLADCFAGSIFVLWFHEFEFGRYEQPAAERLNLS